LSSIEQPYHIGVVDIGSPKLGNIGWCFINIQTNKVYTGGDLDDLFPHLIQASQSSGILLGLEAPLFVPLRPNLMEATKGRKGEGRRPWSAGAGAQVLALNLPIMSYIFKALYKNIPDSTYFLNEDNFRANSGEIMIFEALVSGVDKGSDHIHDAQIMASSCLAYSHAHNLPPSILEMEKDTEYLNLSAAALLRCGALHDVQSLPLPSPIYKPSNKPL